MPSVLQGRVLRANEAAFGYAKGIVVAGGSGFAAAYPTPVAVV